VLLVSTYFKFNLMMKRFLLLILPALIFCGSSLAQQGGVWMGMRFKPVVDSIPPGLDTSKATGLWVLEVLGGTSANLKLLPGDRLLSLNNQALKSADQLRQILAGFSIVSLQAKY
jgi:membrane-associated protease RseP (regulator of RpoE activity)